MAPVRNARVIYESIPKPGLPQVGRDIRYDAAETIDPDAVDLQGGVLLRNLAVSIDPYQRGRMRDPSQPSYSPAYQLGKPLINHGVGKVLRSDHPGFAKGQCVFGIIGFEEYTVLSKAALAEVQTRTLENKDNLPWTKWTGVLGMPGMTASYGFYEIGQPQKGETIFISAASGAVGQIVGQLAKREGLTVVGSVGSDEKGRFLKEELGFDHVFNYKKVDTAKELAKTNGIDIYWENVGGPTLDAVLNAANKHCRIVACGMISQYNVTGEPYGVKSLGMIVAKSMTMKGFIIVNPEVWASHAPRFYRDMPAWTARGEIKSKEDVTKGLESAADALVGIFEGKNFGKAVVEIWDGKEA